MKTVRVKSNPPGTTVTQASTDTAAALTGIPADAEGALITCEDNDVKFAFTATPVSSGLGHVIAKGDSINLPNRKFLDDMKVISSTAGSAGTLMITWYLPMTGVI